jgi:hypothetical protein
MSSGVPQPQSRVSRLSLDRYVHSSTFRKNPNQFRLEDHAFRLLGVGRSRTEQDETRHRISGALQKATKETSSEIRLPRERLGEAAALLTRCSGDTPDDNVLRDRN